MKITCDGVERFSPGNLIDQYGVTPEKKILELVTALFEIPELQNISVGQICAGEVQLKIDYSYRIGAMVGLRQWTRFSKAMGHTLLEVQINHLMRDTDREIKHLTESVSRHVELSGATGAVCPTVCTDVLQFYEWM